MRVVILDDYASMSHWIASYVADKINLFEPTEERPFVLGLPTGSTPVGAYEELIRYHREGALSFRNVVTFNMDEYVGLPDDHPESYHHYMYSHFFNHIDIPPENINILDGNAVDLAVECERFENGIKAVGGIHLFLGGLGEDGHIAFNEPGSSLSSRTRVKTLNYDTLMANSRFFDDDLSKVPKTALTVGVGTVMDADEVIILASGYNKARALQKSVEEGVNHMWTVSMLQLHRHGMIVCDSDSTMELKVGTVRYFRDIERKNI